MYQCLALASSLGDAKLAYPDNPAYDASLGSYHSAQQAGIRPACIISPQTTQDVSEAVKILAKHTPDGICKFAIRSGGHTSCAGGSNIAGGVTLDLRGLNSINVVDGGKTVQVGSGALWGAVYRKLDPLGRSVAGGRVAGVGVAGLTLGGGISHLSPQHGWTCDTVRNFEVVLGDGSIVNANDEENKDLFFALRGGGNSFGIVTRADLETHEQGLLWHASLLCDSSALESNIKEFVRLSTGNNYDENASFMLSFAYIGSMRLSAIVNTLIYVDAVENPPFYQKLMELPALQVRKGLKDMTTLSIETEAMVAKGARLLYRTQTVISTEDVLHAAHRLWNEAASAVRDVAGISWVLCFDPLPPSFYAPHATSNAMGLTGRDGNTLLVLQLDVRWSEAADDGLVESTAKWLFDNVSCSILYALFIPLSPCGSILTSDCRINRSRMRHKGLAHMTPLSILTMQDQTRTQ